MRHLQSKHLIWLKAFLFLFIGCFSVALILWQVQSWNVALLLGLAIWAFCRLYYFAFYVLEKYVDPNFRYSGICSLAHYLWQKWWEEKTKE